MWVDCALVGDAGLFGTLHVVMMMSVVDVQMLSCYGLVAVVRMVMIMWLPAAEVENNGPASTLRGS